MGETVTGVSEILMAKLLMYAVFVEIIIRLCLLNLAANNIAVNTKQLNFLKMLVMQVYFYWFTTKPV